MISFLKILFLCLILSGCSGSKTASDTSMSKNTMIDLLSKNLGITDSQTEAGIGAMMMLSRNKLSSEDFAKLSKSIPGGANNLINRATALGVIPGTIGTSVDVVNVLYKVGVSPVTASRFISEVMGFSQNFGTGAYTQLSKVF